MVIARLHPQRQLLACFCTGGFEQFRLELFHKEVIRPALIHQKVRQARAAFDQGTGIIFSPSRLIGAKITRQRLMPPGAVERRNNGCEG